MNLENLGNLPRATVAGWRRDQLQSIVDPEKLRALPVCLIRIFAASMFHSFGGRERSDRLCLLIWKHCGLQVSNFHFIKGEIKDLTRSQSGAEGLYSVFKL